MNSLHIALEVLARQHLNTKIKVKPFVYKHSEVLDAVTIVPKIADAFNLNPPISGVIKTHVSIATSIIEEDSLADNVIAIHRSIIGYSAAAESVEDSNVFIFTMVAYINSALIELTNKLGDLNRFDISLNRPGTEFIFTESQSHAGFEFRVVVKRKVDV